MKDEKRPGTTLSVKNENIVIVISMILSKGSRIKAYDLMNVLLREKHVTFNENYIITHLKTGMKIDIQEFLRGILVMKSKVKENEVFFKAIMNHILNDIIWNPKLINLNENQKDNSSIGGGSKSRKDFPVFDV